MNTSLLRNIVTIHSVPTRIVVLTLVASVASEVAALVLGMPLWAAVVAGLAPWVPLFTREMVWTYRQYGLLALYYVLVVTQGGHMMEHVAQMVQIHMLGWPGPQAHGVFGALDTEWVHVIWNSVVFVSVVVLLWRFRANRWLWLTLLFAGWHQIEHMYIMSIYLSTGIAGTPGLLSRGGAIAGGLAITRADLHFLYNLVETTPLLIGFVVQFRREREASES